MTPRNLLALCPFLVAAVAASPMAAAQTPTVVIRTQQVPTGGTSNSPVSQIGSIDLAPDGGWAVTLRTAGALPVGYKVWGNLTGGPGSVIRNGGNGPGYQHRFYGDSFGVAGGNLIYNPCVVVSGFCFFGVWIDDTPITRPGLAGPVPNSIWGDEYAHVGATSAGEPWFMGEYEVQSVSHFGLFVGDPLRSIVMTGDQPALLPHPVATLTVGLIDVSRSGVHSIAEVVQDCVSCNTLERKAVLKNGDVLMIGGAPYLGLASVPAALGGQGEAWHSLRHVDVNDTGGYALTGSTRRAGVLRSYLLRNGEFLWRQGDPFLDGSYGSTEDLELTNAGDLYHISTWVDAGGEEQHGIFVNDELIVRAGDEIDFDGDSVVDTDSSLDAFRSSLEGNPRFVVNGGSILVRTKVASPSGTSHFAILRIENEPGDEYCEAVLNSTGSAASMSAFGSDAVADGNLRLRASSLPTGSTGFFVVGDGQVSVLGAGGSAGRLCVGGTIGRFVRPGQIQLTDASGRIELRVNLNELPTPLGLVAVLPGQKWNFTAWFRDQTGGTPTSNFANGLSVTFR